MKNRIFSLGLYKDALKQTRIFGILALTASLFMAIFIPITQTFNAPISKTVVTLSDISLVLYVLPYIITPILCIILFGFMNKRNASDFYHSIAIRRSGIYFSFVAAILTWIIIILTATLIAGISVHLIISKYFIINYAQIFLDAFGILSSSLFALFVIISAMSLTGNPFTNVILSGLILFLPDLLLSLISSVILNNIPIMSSEITWERFLPSGFNIMCTLNSSNNGITAIFDSTAQNLYTLGLSAILCIVALLLFKKRKSETASYPLQSRVLASAFRILCSFTVTIFAACIIFDQNYNCYNYFDSSQIYVAVIIYILAVIVYFACELIMTKSFKTFKRIIPALSIVFILNALLIAVMAGVYNYNLSFVPSSDEIDYIRIPANLDYNLSLNSLLDQKAQDIKLCDDDLNKLISKALKDDVEDIKNNSYFESDTDIYYTADISKKIIISVNGIEHTRIIKFNDAENSLITEYLRNNDEYRRVYQTLPDPSKVSVSFCHNLKNEDAIRIYEIMREEVSELDFEKWYNISNGHEGYAISYDIGLTFQDGSKLRHFTLPIYLDLKRSATEYIKCSYDNESSDRILNCDLDEIDEVTVISYNGNELYNFFFLTNNDPNEQEAFNEFLGELEPADKLNDDSTIIEVMINTVKSDSYGEWTESISSYFCYNGDINDLKKKY